MKTVEQFGYKQELAPILSLWDLIIYGMVFMSPIGPFPLPRQNGAYEFRGLEYRFWAVGLDDYVAHLRSRGPAWKAVAMARRAFRRRVRPLLEWLPMSYDWSRRPIPVKERQR